MKLFRITAVLLTGCTLVTLASINHWFQLHSEEADHDFARTEARLGVSESLADYAASWSNFNSAAQALERRLRKLEQDVEVHASSIIDAEKGGSSDSLPSKGSADMVEPLAAVAATPSPSLSGKAAKTSAPKGKVSEQQKAPVRWRADYKCGKNAPANADGSAAECNPFSDYPCCSPGGWCGGSGDHCNCQGCTDYRQVYRERNRVAFVPPPLPKRSGVKTIAVMIPFRDREGHLVKFKEYWRWFAKEGHGGHHKIRWEIMVMEQFDSQVFNRGWCFNVGLAVASVQKGASPEITEEMGVPYDCAVIQDIDYLPDKGVDYTDCAVPIQLSAEIDRYNWRTPYLESAGGIVGANLTHWYQINGFSNGYFGWGGEDDELHHRFRLNKLLYGDCHPFCSDNDPKKGRIGISIKRPPKGYGRFLGEHMHSANHTKRITDCGAYKRNLGLLEEIRRGGPRWRGDGMSNLAFRIVYHKVDTTDLAEYGITYHHIKAHRGHEEFSLHDIPFIVRRDFCTPSATGVVSGTVATEWRNVPWTLDALRARAAEVLGVDKGQCVGAKSGSFILLDRRYNLAKLYPDPDEDRLLVVFYRWLASPSKDGMILADSRPPSQVVKAFNEASAFWAPPMAYVACTSKIAKGVKYGVNEGLNCMCGWDKIKGARWYGQRLPQSKSYAYCDNEKYWTQKIVEGDSCPEQWSGLKWKMNSVFYAQTGSGFCVGSRLASGEAAYSRLLPRSDCGGDGFTHEFTFATVRFSRTIVPPVVCLTPKSSSKSITSYTLSTGVECAANGADGTLRFPARRDIPASPGNRTFCVFKVAASSKDGYSGDSFALGKQCQGQKALFSMPSIKQKASEGEGRQKVCAGPLLDGSGGKAIGVGAACGSKVKQDATFLAPSMVDIALSIPRAAGSSTAQQAMPLFTLVHEEVTCAGFFCEHLLTDDHG